MSRSSCSSAKPKDGNKTKAFQEHNGEGQTQRLMTNSLLACAQGAERHEREKEVWKVECARVGMLFWKRPFPQLREGQSLWGGRLPGAILGHAEEFGRVSVDGRGRGAGWGAAGGGRVRHLVDGDGGRHQADLLIGGFLSVPLVLPHLVHGHVFAGSLLCLLASKLLVCGHVHLILELTHILQSHSIPLINPRESLPVSHQQDVTDDLVYKLLDSGLKAPDLEFDRNQLVRAHDWLAAFSPSFLQGPPPRF